MPGQPNSIMIFAAGFGTRMGHLTSNTPKPLVTVGGMPLIDHSIALAKNAGLENITANLHYHHAQLARHLTAQGVALSLELPDILETGGGLRHALPLVGNDPVFTLNPDTIWHGKNPLTELARMWNPDKMDALLLVIPPENAHSHAGAGDFVLDTDNRLDRGAGMIYSGAQIIKTDRLHEIKEKAFSLNRLWDLILADKRAFGLPYQGQWCDVGTPAGLESAEKLLKDRDV